MAQTCSVSSMPTVAFGNVDVTGGSPVDTTTTVTVTCSGYGGAGARVCISIGMGSVGDATSRQLLAASGDKLRYDLYTDAARTQLWGSWETGYHTAGVQLDMLNGTRSVTVYARLFASQQTAPPGSYSSTFTSDPFIRYRQKGGAPPCPTGTNTASASSSATATVISVCYVSAGNLDFGTAGVLTASIDGSSRLKLQCSNGTPYNIGLNAGTGPGATVANRKMTSGGNTVGYSLYSDSARTTVWGETIGVDTVAGSGTGLSANVDVYGRVPAQITPAPATYTDTIVVTVTY